jgi:clan AA aspartic protease (TIGR02281 family)
MEAMTGCYAHPQVVAVGACRSCHQSLCDVCAVRDSNYRVRCGVCQRAASRRKLIVGLVGAGVVTVAAVVGGLYYRRAMREAAAAEELRRASEPPPFDYGVGTEHMGKLRARVQQEPCDRRAILELANAAFGAGDHRGVLFHTEKFFKKCGDYPRLRWLSYEAHKQVGEWKQAGDEATKLIASDPHDADFRGWRGLVHEQTGDLEHAAEDYRQALLLKPQLRDLPINLANVYEKQGKHCEAILPLAQLVFYAGEVPGVAAIRSRILGLETRPECSWSLGEGQAVLRRPPGENVFLTPVSINGTDVGTFIVDTGATEVVLSRRMADKLKLDLNGAPLFIAETANGITTGTGVVLNQVSVQGLRANHVAAAVTDGLGSVDGLLGMSFLTRFELWQDGASLKISTRKR